jgi:hypothetical protein
MEFVYFLFRWCQIPPGHLQIKFAALDIVKTQLFLIALLVIKIVKYTFYIRLSLTTTC